MAWARELVVIDSFSDDATVALARTRTNHVIQRSWPGMVGPQRNAGLDQTTSDWVLFLDADERITPELQAEISAFLDSPEAGVVAAVAIPRRNYFFGRWLRCSYPDYTWRLLRRNSGSRYNEIPGRGFDSLVANGPVIRFRQPMTHLTGETIAMRIRKIDFDSSLQADEKFLAGHHASLTSMVTKPVLAFLKIYFLKRGIFDGAHGFIFAVLASFNTFAKYAKLWEKYLEGSGKRRPENGKDQKE
jgi:glycosyltransferase involved in cell wall biosynthesis